MTDAQKQGPVKVEPLTERVLAALMQVDPNMQPKKDKSNLSIKHDSATLLALPIDKSPLQNYSHSYIIDIEERMKFELRTLGLLDDVPVRSFTFWTSKKCLLY
jgi:hypothetical protein